MRTSLLYSFIIIGTFLLGITPAVYGQSNILSPRLVVSKPTQPSESLALPGALHVPFTTVDLTARNTDITVHSITVMRTGPAVDAIFDEILLIDDSGEELGGGSLDADHLVRFTEPIFIPVNTTLRIIVAANIADELAEFDGQKPSLTITEISATGYTEVSL